MRRNTLTSTQVQKHFATGTFTKHGISQKNNTLLYRTQQTTEISQDYGVMCCLDVGKAIDTTFIMWKIMKKWVANLQDHIKYQYYVISQCFESELQIIIHKNHITLQCTCATHNTHIF